MLPFFDTYFSHCYPFLPPSTPFYPLLPPPPHQEKSTLILLEPFSKFAPAQTVLSGHCAQKKWPGKEMKKCQLTTLVGSWDAVVKSRKTRVHHVDEN